MLDLASASRADIEREISNTVLYLSHLRTHLNRHTPIARLPPEVLLEIFSDIVGEWKASLTVPNFSRRFLRIEHAYTWLGITQVCHHWRNLTTGYPNFWNTILLNKQNYIRLMFLRVMCHVSFSARCISRVHVSIIGW